MPTGCNCGPNSPLAQALGYHCVRRAVLQSLPVSCHFRGCKVPLFRIVSGAISSELALPFALPFMSAGIRENSKGTPARPSCFVCDGRQLKRYTLSDWQPVQLTSSFSSISVLMFFFVNVRPFEPMRRGSFHATEHYRIV